MSPARTQPRAAFLRKLRPITCSLSLVLVGCSNTAESTTTDTAGSTETSSQISPTTPVSTTEAAPPEDPSANALEEYAQILANPSIYPLTEISQFVPTGTYAYTLVEATSDSIPKLLLRADSHEFAPILVFTYDENTQSATQAGGVLIDGVASAGGSRVKVRASNSGAGIYQLNWYSIQPVGESSLYGIQGNSLTQIADPEDFMVRELLPDHHEITWVDSNDPSGLSTVQTGGANIQQAAPTPVQQPASNLHYFSGVVTMQTAGELMRGERTPNGEPATDLYLVLVLDSPIEITARNAATDPQTRTISEVSLGRYIPADGDNDWIGYLDTHVEITATTDQVWFPTDTGLPLGMLRLADYKSIS